MARGHSDAGDGRVPLLQPRALRRRGHGGLLHPRSRVWLGGMEIWQEAKAEGGRGDAHHLYA